LLMPLLIVAAGCLVKIALAHASGGNVELPRVAGMSIKALGWAFFAGSIGFAANSLVSNMALVTKVYCPRELFPFSAVITQLIDTCVGGGFLLILLGFFANITISVQWLWAAPVVLLLVAVTTAVALLLSCANVFFRDVKYIVQIVLTFGIFFTPVFYEPELFGSHGSFVMMLNPLAPILEALRLAIVEKHNLLLPVIAEGHGGVQFTTWHIGFLIYSAIISLGGLLWAWRYFHRMEFQFAEYV
ncbi:ABC transporter permease, partial [Thermogutta sp.]|uniref:ABC transporter permease n=1 Tax=Thermogutta sp. TaxID=1962930 RepID=UPI00321FDF56